MSLVRSLAAASLLLACLPHAFRPLSAAEPAAQDWPPQITRRLPPIAKPLKEEDRKKVEAALAEIRAGLAEVKDAVPEDLVDIEIFAKALDYALRHNEFFDAKKDVPRVETLRKEALRRIESLKQGKQPLMEARGLIVRGFRSRLDDSVQPYGVVIPEKIDLGKKQPLYVWLHGRGDTTCDLQFISSFLGTKAPGAFQLDDAIVIHPFGRYCNGYKSAGELDVIEAIADAQRCYNIDGDCIVLAGFSMGGAGAWHLGAHYPDLWCAVHAGAGFVDVKRYQKLTPEQMPPWYVQKLWGMYDVPDYKRNFLDVPLVAYSGENDKQKAAADIMEQELAAEGMKLTHLIGPGMEHKYHPEVLKEVQKRLAEFVAHPRRRDQADHVQTRTLRYAGDNQVQFVALEKHWDDSRIDIVKKDGDLAKQITTKNVAALAIKPPAVRIDGVNELMIDGQAVVIDGAKHDYLGQALVVKQDGKWAHVAKLPPAMMKGKLGGRQGPIDDAFLSPFYFVAPATPGSWPLVDRWVEFESKHASDRWRSLMRGEVRTAAAADIDEEWLSSAPQYLHNVVLWGTPQTNPAIAKILDKLPIKWTETTVGMGDLEFDATKVVPVLIYPNPLNPAKYVVLNSGLTFREAHDKTNSQQNPKLPDWAFIDVTQPPTDELPGKVLAAGFFDEQWRYQKQPPADQR